MAHENMQLWLLWKKKKKPNSLLWACSATGHPQAGAEGLQTLTFRTQPPCPWACGLQPMCCRAQLCLIGWRSRDRGPCMAGAAQGNLCSPRLCIPRPGLLCCLTRGPLRWLQLLELSKMLLFLSPCSTRGPLLPIKRSCSLAADRDRDLRKRPSPRPSKPKSGSTGCWEGGREGRGAGWRGVPWEHCHLKAGGLPSKLM